MDKAKSAVKDILHKSGHHDTTIHEHVAPAVTNETVSQRRHEQVTQAVDREVHQDHHHTAIQPVKDREVLPEQHSHNQAAVQHREHHHGDHSKLERGLEQERAQFRDTRTDGGIKETHSTAPTVTGEHVHHHVHETIQPVVNKETIQPSVVHTTVPVHEVHHNAPQHHSASALPAMSMSEFKSQGGSLGGREDRYDSFEGEPKPVGIGNTHGSSGGLLHKGATGTESQSASTNAGPHNSNLANKADPRVDSDRDGSRNMGAAATSTGTASGTGGGMHPASTANTRSGMSDTTTPGHMGSGTTGTTPGMTGTGTHGTTTGITPGTHGTSTGPTTGTHGTGASGYGVTHTPGTGPTGTSGTSDVTTEKAKKPSLLDKLNPMKDTDRDGKKGMMD